MCGIVGVAFQLERRARRAPAGRRMAACAHASRPRRRGLALSRGRGLLPQAPRDHRPGHRPPADDVRGRHDRRSTARSTTTWSCASELQRAGHEFRTTSDTEVILADVRASTATACVEQLNGMFAFLLYDRERGGCSPRAIISASSRCTSPTTAGSCSSPPRSRRCCAHPDVRAERRTRGAPRLSHLSVRAGRRARCSAACGSCCPGTTRWSTSRSRRRAHRAYWEPRFDSTRTTPRSTSSSECAGCSRTRSGSRCGATCRWAPI